ncbi:sensor histidine kinase [Agathobaculum sp.]|uniref:sensor histidine kinase n=1 Tax=Agathobaculum sp. TaxID=2048138 RepID=UPI002A7ED0F7|nr:histidine kinase [Agathobaculum sp.]MDY3617985.1 histidine kinase [Agathobaculum sp.]
MKLHSIALSRLLLLLLTGFGLPAAAFCAGLAMGKISPLPAGLLMMADAVLCAIALVVLIGRPLSQMEQALKMQEGDTLETRLSRIADLPEMHSHTLGRSLLDFEKEIHAQYTAALIDTQAELDALQSQINPHFLYNTLDSIRGQALYEGVPDIADMTGALSAFFRYSISNRNSIVTLEEELENVRDYFEIQQFRFNNRFRLRILPAAREDVTQCRLPKLSLQPIVENAILHGMEGKLGEGTITIRIEGTARLISVTVSDDGMGMNNETLQRVQARVRGETVEAGRQGRGGLALPNVARRIRLLFGETYGMQVMSTPGIGTDVVLTLPRDMETAEEQNET